MDLLLVLSSTYGMGSTLLFLITKLVYSKKFSNPEKYLNNVQIFTFTLLAASFFINLYKGLEKNLTLSHALWDCIFVFSQITMFLLTPIKFIKEYKGEFCIHFFSIIYFIFGIFFSGLLCFIFKLLDYSIFLVFNLSNLIFLVVWVLAHLKNLPK